MTTDRIGSSSTGWQRGSPSLSARAAAMRKLISLLSTEWNWPSMEGDADIDDGKAQGALLQEVPGPGLDGGDELPWHRAPHDLVVEGEAGTALERADLDLDVAELPVPAGLLLVAAVRLGGLADRLAVGRPGRARLDLHIVLRPQPVQRHAQMHLALPPEHDLVHLGILLEPQRGVLVDELGEGTRQLDLVVAVGGGEREGEHRCRRRG